jgi:hypothetical protein
VTEGAPFFASGEDDYTHTHMLLKHTNTQVVKRKILRQVIQVRMGVVGIQPVQMMILGVRGLISALIRSETDAR